MKLRNILLGAVALLGFAACQNKEQDADPAVSVDVTSIEFDQAGGSQTISFTSAASWELRGAEDWLAANPTSGKGSSATQTITVEATPNADKDREATLTIYSSPLAKKSITVTQKGAKGDGVEELSIADFIAKADANNDYKLKGVVSGYSNGDSYWGFDLQDATGKVSCPFPANWDDFKAEIANGDEVTVTGPYQWYEKKSAHQVKNCTIVEVVKATPVDPSTIETITCAEFIAKADAVTDYRLVGKVTSTVNTTYCSFDMSDDNGVSTVVVWTVNNAADWKDIVKKDGTVTVRGKYTRYEKDGNVKHEMIDAYIENFTEAEPTPGGTPEGDGTEANPYNATAAVQAASALEADVESSDFYYIKGFVKSVKSIDTGSYGNANFYITDTAAGDTDEFYCYQIMYINGEMFTSTDQLKVGDEVVVYAKLVNYKGNTPETVGKGTGKLISINGSTDVPDYISTSVSSLSVSAEAGSITFDVKSNVAWTVASNSEDFTVSPASGEGVATVTVTYTANAAEADREAVITVSSSVKNVEVKVTQRAKSPEGADEFDFDLVNATWTAETDATYKAGYTATQDGVTVGVYKNTSSTDVKTTYNPFRFYKNHAMVISSDKNITKIIFTENQDDSTKVLALEIDGTEVAVDGGVVTWTGSSNKVVVIATKGQVRFDKLTITVE